MAEGTKTTTATSMDDFKNTPYYQGLGIEGLQAQLAGYQQDDAQLRRQAEAQYQPTYESELDAVRQGLARELQGYNAQLAGTGAAYDQQRRRTGQAYDESAAEMNNSLTKRGLGRSSLVATQGAYLQNQRNQALSDIDRAEKDAISAINERIALLTEQAAQSERTLAGNYARQLESRINEMRMQNQTAAISLQLQIAALQQQGYEAYQDWLLGMRQQELAEQEFEAEYGGGTGSSGSGGGGGSGSGKTASGTAENGKGGLSQRAAAVASAMADLVRRVTGGLEGGVRAAAGAQSSGNRTTGRNTAPTNRFRPNAKK